MATADGSWYLNPWEHVQLFPDNYLRSSESKKEPKKNHSKKQRKHHYAFDVDDNGLDINGFILHTDKHEGKRHKFRVYLDSNENNRFDNNDQLIGRKGIRSKHAAKGVGSVLDEDAIGQVEVQFKKNNSNASMRDASDIYPGGGEVHNPFEDYFMKLTDPDGGTVVQFPFLNVDPDDSILDTYPTPDNLTDTDIKEDQDGLIPDPSTTLNSAYMDDPEWQKGWQEHCTGDAKPPYPEDCFFGYPYS